MIPFGACWPAERPGCWPGAVPALGTLAAVGLVVYFIGAVSAHIRVRDPKVTAAVSFLVMAIAALVVGVGYRYHW